MPNTNAAAASCDNPTAQANSPMTGQATDVANDPLNATDPTGMCRGGDPDGKCEFATSVSDSKNAGAVAAAKEKGDAALQRIDKSIQGLGDDTTYKYQSTEGTTISQTGAEIKTQWNDQSFTMTDQSDFGNSGGGTAAYGNTVMNAENFSGWEALGQGEFILLHDGMAHTSRVGQGVLQASILKHNQDVAAGRTSGGFYDQTAKGGLASPYARFNETYANAHARGLMSVARIPGVVPPAPPYGYR